MLIVITSIFFSHLSGKYFFIFYCKDFAPHENWTSRCGLTIKLFRTFEKNGTYQLEDIQLTTTQVLEEILNNSKIEIRWADEDFLLIRAPYGDGTWLYSCSNSNQQNPPR